VSESLLLTDTDDPSIAEAVALLDGWRIERLPRTPPTEASAWSGVRMVLLHQQDPSALRLWAEYAHSVGVPVVIAVADEAARRRAVELRAEEWFNTSSTAEEIAARIRSALGRGLAANPGIIDRVERVEFQEMLHDSLTGLPTLPVAIDRIRSQFKDRGELIVLYLNFVRYSKIEEIYGWEKLDAVLETTAAAVREFLDSTKWTTAKLMVSFTNDDDFIFFHVPAPGVAVATQGEIADMAARLQTQVQSRIEAQHGEDISALIDIYVGSGNVYYNPKIRLERLIYRGIREAADASRSVEELERARRISDLRDAIRERAVYVDYHPIVEAESKKIFGYEALARGVSRPLRSPEVMFDVAAQADLVWELSRLCRSRAIEGMSKRLQANELLFLNVDPHDFSDPLFNENEVENPERVVIEITERTAIKDYPKFRERLKAFRDKGFRFAVDDAGSGYAGLGSIANLEPDFIKLDISLINSIDTNFIKQNLVEGMVRFANEHGAMVIAEGVERAEEFQTVKDIGVHLVQGFFLHKPSGAPVLRSSGAVITGTHPVVTASKAG
jgi:EAL domain-containing protein (putative c-di-GMP-specific phosphodiesterase class I)/GGDEF domain-containing protein